MTPIWRAVCIGSLAGSVFVGCRPTSEVERRLLAANESWRVWAVGDLDHAGSLLFRTSVTRFSVDSRGQAYASDLLYEAGGNDHSFNDRFPQVEWLRGSPFLSSQ